MGCQSTLLRLVEDWRNALDNCQYAAAILMDLSKACDCLPHGLLLGKLRAYGLSVKACALVAAILVTGNRQLSLDHTIVNGQISLKGYQKGPFWALCCSMFL